MHKMLLLLDLFLTLLHLLIIGFNLFGWIFPATRRLHFIFILLTGASWFILGIWFGIGYCPITDWQWQVKEKLGETNLPNSFITYIANKITGRHFNDAFIDRLVLISFVSAVLLSVYFNFFKRRKAPTVKEQ